MKLTQKQASVITNKSRFKVLNWGRRSGKTTVFAWEAMGTALTIPNAKITYYAQTFGDARDIAWDIFLEVFGDAVVKKNETLLEITVRNLKGGTSLISLKGWESVYQSGKGRGTENDLILADEVAFCRQFMEYFDKVLAPTLLTTKGRAVFGSTPNGFNDFHVLTQRAITNPDWFYSHATSYDNEANDPAEIERIKREISEDRFAQEYLADFRKLEGLVYKDFDRAKHVFTDLVPIREINRVIGVDFGWTNPTSILTILVDYDNTYYVTDEYYKTGKNMEEIINYCKTTRGNSYYPDPAEPDRIEEMRKAGLNVQDVSKDIEFGITCVQRLFKMNKIKIHSSCSNLIFELENYRYPDKKPGHNENETPIKENDHALDALRYALYNTAPVEDDSFMIMKVSRNRMSKATMQ
jgi:hypothetical protein